MQQVLVTIKFSMLLFIKIILVISHLTLYKNDIKYCQVKLLKKNCFEQTEVFNFRECEGPIHITINETSDLIQIQSNGYYSLY